MSKESEERRGFEDALRRYAGGHAEYIDYWHGRRRGEAFLAALAKEAARPHYFYGDGPYLYETQKSA